MSTNTTRHNPLCGYSLQDGSKALAMVNMIMSGVGLSQCFMAVLKIGTQKAGISTGQVTVSAGDVDFGLALVLFLSTLLCIEMIFSVLLYYGAKEASYTKCQTWYLVSLVCWTLHLMVFGIMVAGIAFQVLLIVTLAVELIFQMYLIWVVYALMQEIDEHSRSDGQEASISLIEVPEVQF